MEVFLNKLIENIIVINNHREIIFVNQAFLNSLGYKYGEMTLKIVNKVIKIEEDRISFIYDGIVKNGVCQSDPIEWQGYRLRCIIVKWKNKVHCKNDLEMNEGLLNEVEPCSVVKSLKSNFIINNTASFKRVNKVLKYRNKIKGEIEAFLSASTDILLKVNGLKVKSVSESCFDVTGWTKEQILSMDVEEFIHPDDKEYTLRQMKRQAESEENLIFETRIRCANGNYKWLRWSNINYMKTRGYVYASGKDITVEKELELRELEIEKARQLEELKNEFFANISHEFKTPINLIMVSNQLMSKRLADYGLNKNLETEIERYIGIHKQNGYRLLRLVNNLIDITKIDSGFYNIKPINVNIISIIEDIVLSVVEYCRGNEIELIFDTEVEEEIIACDPDQIERIILNLLSNAIKYTSKNGTIRVLISLEEEYVVVKVIDTGVGIPKERLNIIFQRFGRGEDILTKTCEGSGIGLSLVKALVEMHEGTISVLSEVRVGSTFEIKFPRKQTDISRTLVESQEIKQSKIEKCSIEFSDIYKA